MVNGRRGLQGTGRKKPRTMAGPLRVVRTLMLRHVALQGARIEDDRLLHVIQAFGPDRLQ